MRANAKTLLVLLLLLLLPALLLLLQLTEDGQGGYVITEEFVLAMLAEFKAQRLIHRRFAFQILLQVREGIDHFACCDSMPLLC